METADPNRFRWPEGTVVEPDGTIVFRPSWANYRAKVLKVPVFILVIVVLNLLRLDDPAVAALIIVATFAVSIGGVALYFRRAVTSVGPRGLVRKDVVRSTKVAKGQLGDVIFVRELAHYDQRTDTTLIVTDTAGRKVAMFNGPFWSPDQLAAIAAALQQPTWQPDEPVSYRDVRARYPKAVPLAYARPFAFAFAVVFGLLAVTVAVVVAIVLATG